MWSGRKVKIEQENRERERAVTERHLTNDMQIAQLKLPKRYEGDPN